MELTFKAKIYNKDCRLLAELANKTVDYVVTSPPFNISHKYMTYHDSLDYKDFDDLYTSVTGSVSRVLKDDGFFIVDIADIIVMENVIVYGAEFIKEKMANCGMRFICSFPYVAVEGSDVQMESCIARNDRRAKFHSTCEQILVFGKSMTPCSVAEHMPIKPLYTYSAQRDSAFWPDNLINDMMAPFDFKGKLLLEPFMGSGTIGRRVLEQGGYFIGYDVDADTLKTYKWL